MFQIVSQKIEIVLTDPLFSKLMIPLKSNNSNRPMSSISKALDEIMLQKSISVDFKNQNRSTPSLNVPLKQKPGFYYSPKSRTHFSHIQLLHSQLHVYLVYHCSSPLRLIVSCSRP